MRRKLRKVCVIGGGFYGCMAALELSRYFEETVIIEKDTKLLNRASLNNQARVHQGYHYPRSISTGRSSCRNYKAFIDEFEEAAYSEFEAYYVVAAEDSHITAEGFELFCNRIGAPLLPARGIKRKYFDNNSVEEVYRVKEAAFNSHTLEKLINRKLKIKNVDVRLETEASIIRPIMQSYRIVCTSGVEVDCDWVFVCAYSGTNSLLANSKMKILPIRYEMAEMALIDVPDNLKNKSFTVMDGPFFSLFPFPISEVHSLSHVRYTPHFSWIDMDCGKYSKENSNIKQYQNVEYRSHHKEMIQSASLFIPCIADSQYIRSIWEIKATLQSSESTDSRPILMARSHNRLYSILGSKLDNVADARRSIRKIILNELEQVIH